MSDGDSGRGPVKRSVTIAGHSTSLSLEPEFWQALGDLARRGDKSMSQLVTEIDATRGSRNLSSAVRVHLLHAAADGRIPARVLVSVQPAADLRAKDG